MAAEDNIPGSEESSSGKKRRSIIAAYLTCGMEMFDLVRCYFQAESVMKVVLDTIKADSG